MGAGDELRFKTETLQRKVERLREVATRVETDSGKNAKDVALLKTMSLNMDTYYDSFSEVVAKLAAYNNKQTPRVDTDLQAYIVKFEENFYEAKAIVSAMCPGGGVANQPVATAGPAQASSPAQMIALPKLDLPKFDGDIKSWATFADIFVSSVHLNTAVPDVLKFMHLKAVLKGDALSLIASLPLTASNYNVAWDALQNRYSDNTLQTNAYLEILVDYPAISRTPATLRSLAAMLSEYTGALKALGHDVEGWAVLLLFILRRKLTSTLRERWEKDVINQGMNTIVEFIRFLNEEARILEATCEVRSSVGVKPQMTHSYQGQHRLKGPTALVVSTLNPKSQRQVSCPLCRERHDLAKCQKFGQMSTSKRLGFIKGERRCLRCLLPGHYMSDCNIPQSCSHCSSKHHSLLHFGEKKANFHQSNGGDNRSMALQENGAKQHLQQNAPNAQLVAAVQAKTPLLESSVLLSTAIAQLKDRWGQYHSVRILLDCASQGTFVTRACAHKLGWKPKDLSVPVFGMGQTTLGTAEGIVQCTFKASTMDTIDWSVNALIIDKIATCPAATFERQNWPHLDGLPLADPTYYCTKPVDLLLGAEWFTSTLLGNRVVGPPGTPSAIETIWGYCLMGRVGYPSNGVSAFCINVDKGERKLHNWLRCFWELEEPPATVTLSVEDSACEDHYKSTVSRAPEGKYIVELPFRTRPPRLGNSRSAALRRFHGLERRLERCPEMRTAYNDFMQDYITQGHMVSVAAPSTQHEYDNECYYIPHHCIHNDSPKLGKFRVVFDASMTTSSGHSLNQILYTGPKLQLDIIDILIGLRLHEIVLSADIKQMYRNIYISHGDYDFQRIFWRYSPEEQLGEYCLTTVTYGISSSPFLAIRTLHQLARDEGSQYPAARNAILNSTYMDDIVKSVPSVAEALTLQSELIQLMGKGGFQLRKWMSNQPDILASLPVEDCAVRPDSFTFTGESESITKILGLEWKPIADCFSYKIKQTPSNITKRTILSEIARLYDPMGFLSPVIFVGKLLIQHLWQLGLNWDERPPEDVCTKWSRFQKELPQVSRLMIRRCLQVSTAINVQLHGFSDSSEKGYAAVVYLRAVQPSGEVIISIILAKSKVAPVKRVTLPRLELCGVVLMARLLKRVSTTLALTLKAREVTAWCDSKVALYWVKSSPSQWKTFIANRVSQAQEYLEPNQFRHVPTATNPADCASRGLFPGELLTHPLWLTGPAWLAEDEIEWPQRLIPTVGPSDEEVHAMEARVLSCMTQIEPDHIEQMLNRISSLSLLKRVTAYCLRFAFNCRAKNSKRLGYLTTRELKQAMEALVQWVQHKEFAADWEQLKAGRSATTRLRKLNPFIDENGLLRVGGRLRHAAIAFGAKHPVLLPKTSRLTELIVDHYHKLYLHPGPGNLHCIIQQEFWILHGRDVIRRRLSRCQQCFRMQPRPVQPPRMGDLPATRLQAVKPFSVVGVDYGGPFQISLGRLRKARVYKGYICIFVCFTTRAVHLELASDLTTDAFLAALRRFVARRGAVRAIYSDCGRVQGASEHNAYWEQPFSQPYFDNSTRREVTTTVGQTAHLHCRVRNLGDRAVSWIRKRDLHILTVGILTYTNDQRFQSLHTDGSDEWTLKVTSPQTRDSGIYECQVSTEPKISQAFKLNVVVSKAKILGNAELYIKSGSDINLTCIVLQTPDPPSFIYWYRGGNVINYSQRGGISVVTEKQTRTSRLLISRALPTDSGNYTCSPSSSDAASVLVHVLNGEQPAAMQHGNNSSTAICWTIDLVLLFLVQCFILER